jgi:hypothetical protein
MEVTTLLAIDRENRTQYVSPIYDRPVHPSPIYLDTQFPHTILSCTLASGRQNIIPQDQGHSKASLQGYFVQIIISYIHRLNLLGHVGMIIAVTVCDRLPRVACIIQNLDDLFSVCKGIHEINCLQ